MNVPGSWYLVAQSKESSESEIVPPEATRVWLIGKDEISARTRLA